MKHKTPSPAVLRSCTEAARAAAAHAQESANWAEVASHAHKSAENAAEAANNSAIRCHRLTADTQSAVSRAHAVAVSAYILATLSTVISIISVIALVA